MFILEDGAKISNVIIGATQAEGIHCRGAWWAPPFTSTSNHHLPSHSTIENVWWADVCEDAATFKQPLGSQISYVIGGGAFNAADKVFQFNGRGTVSVSNFYAQDYGKVIRTCGDCTNNGGPRHVIVDNVTAFNGGALCGVNVNFGDTCHIINNSKFACSRITAKGCDATLRLLGVYTCWLAVHVGCQSQGRDCDRFIGVVKGNGSSTKLGRGHDGIACFVESFSGTCW